MAGEILNDFPIVGILAQKSKPIEDYVNEPCSSYIAASYVKLVESAGARVVPIMIGMDERYYEDILSKINGVLMPGGAEWFTEKDGYADAGEHIYKIAKRFNDDGNYFPIFGICLGYELLIYLSANKNEHRKDCKNLGNSSNNYFKTDFRNCKIFKDLSDNLVNIFTNKSVSTFYHMFCITEKVLDELTLDSKWRIISTSKDEEGFEFISTIESERYPFYGVQFHPEKNIYEWNNSYKICHSVDAIKMNRYFGDFFVAESRKNFNKFKDSNELKEKLIYNNRIVYTGLKCNKYVECYIFTN